METTALDDLRDYTSWLHSILRLRMHTDGNDAQQTILDIAEAQSRISDRAARVATPISLLRKAFCLTETETLSLLLLACCAFDGVLRTALYHVHDAGMTIEAIRSLVHGEQPSVRAMRELSADGSLRRYGLLVRCDGGGNIPSERQTWSPSPRALELLLGADSVPPTVRRVMKSDQSCGTDKLVVAVRALTDARTAIRRANAMVYVSGQPHTGRRSLLVACAGEINRTVLPIDCTRLSVTPAVVHEQLAEIAVECRMFRRIPIFLNIDALADEKSNRLEVISESFAPLFDGLILATCGVNRPAMTWDRPVITIEMGPPTSAQRAQLWHSALGEGTEADAELLATQYPLAPALIHHAAEAAKARAAGKAIEPEDIYAGIRSVLDDRLGDFARRVTVTQTWDDIVLSPDHINTLVELMARIRQRRTVYEQWGFAAKVGKGLGVSALFSGPPGTGKTMVAGLIAQDLGLELYQVDLSKIVSKWIGETEKNLAALFDAAEAGHAILLFDEADSLFGKRTDVKSSNDRNANLETNYLLQRLESFTGICLLTTNHDSHIDPAFQRRLSLHLRFDLPEADERALLWKAMLPAAAPVATNVDFAALARRYAMSGGYIRNAALRAAFLAADEGVAISAGHLDRAARVEYEGMGKIAA